MPELNILHDMPAPKATEALGEYDQAVENWLRNEVVPACEALKNNPDDVCTIEEVRAAIAAEHAKRQQSIQYSL